MKGTDHFKKIISDYIESRKASDASFREACEKVNRPIDDVVTYILNYVQQSGCNGFSDDEIFGLAVTCCEESDINIGKPINAHVIVNHHLELSDEEKAQQHAIALKRYQDEELLKMRNRANKPKPATKPVVEAPSLFDF